MHLKKALSILGFVLFLSFTVSSRSGHCAPVIPCEDIKNLVFRDLAFDKPITITSATLVSATATVPEHCAVLGTIWPEIVFAIRLPTATWNGKFRYTGGGGYDGSIPDTSDVVTLGFAGASSNGGHGGAKEPLATFAYNKPDGSNPNWDQKLKDFCYRSVHETANLAKKVIRAYYGVEASRSYYLGCSQGGHEGLMEAQRYPEDFEGYVIGAPVLNESGTQMNGVYKGQALLGDADIPLEKMPTLAKAVYDKCDGLDGLVDGLIDDPRKCPFDPAKDLVTCPADQNANTCFTSAQIGALQKIYKGTQNSAGTVLFPGWPLGMEVLTNPSDPKTSGWAGWILPIPPAPKSRQLLYGETFIQYMAFYPNAKGPTYDWKTFNFDTDPPQQAAIAALIDSVDPNLAAVKNKGAKIIHFHGWADPALTPFMSIDYYESVLKAMGETETKSFYKLYLLPGVFHCGGGVGCDKDVRTLWFQPMVDWVEKGIEPQVIIGTKVGSSGAVVRTRPFCPYPEVARYKGTGSIDDAANFACVNPMP